jgi:hypothetical protein
LLSSSSGEATSAAAHLQDNKALVITASDQVHVSSGGSAQLFAGLHADNVVLSWPGVGMKLQQQGDDWPDGNWVDSADADQRPVFQAIGDGQRMFFRLVEE